MILCTRLPYFAASAARLREQVAPDVPLSVVTNNKVVATCALATEAGVGIGLTARQAQSLVPTLMIVEQEREYVGRFTERLLERLADFTPVLEFETDTPRKPRGKPKRLADEQQSAVVYFDLERLNLVESARLTEQISMAIDELLGIAPRLGLASNKFAALGAAWVSSGELTVIPTGEETAYLAPLSIRRLPLDEEIYRRLTLLGLSTLGQFAALPIDAMLMQFGVDGYGFSLLARGRDSRPVIAHRFGRLEAVSRMFDDPLSRRPALEAVLKSTATELAARLQGNGYLARTLTLTVRLEHGVSHERRITVRQPLADELGLTRALLALLNRMGTFQDGVSQIDVRAASLTPFVGRQLDLFTYAAEQRERLVATVHALTTRYDADRFWWIAPAQPMARRIEQRYQLRGVHEP